jgi:hypothetical protein
VSFGFTDAYLNGLNPGREVISGNVGFEQAKGFRIGFDCHYARTLGKRTGEKYCDKSNICPDVHYRAISWTQLLQAQRDVWLIAAAEHYSRGQVGHGVNFKLSVDIGWPEYQ